MAASEIEQCDARIAREVAAWKAIDEFYKSKGRIDPYPCPDETIMVPGFVGKPKGIKQILWERGLWRPGMVRSKSKAEIKGFVYKMVYLSRMIRMLVDFTSLAMSQLAVPGQGSKSTTPSR